MFNKTIYVIYHNVDKNFGSFFTKQSLNQAKRRTLKTKRVNECKGWSLLIPSLLEIVQMLSKSIFKFIDNRVNMKVSWNSQLRRFGFQMLYSICSFINE